MRALVAAGLLLAAAPASAGFEDSGFSARTLGVGNAVTAAEGDGGTLGFNPATLGAARRPELSIHYSRLGYVPNGPVDLDTGAGTLIFPSLLGRRAGTFGLTASWSDSGDFSSDRELGLTYASHRLAAFGDWTLDLGGTGRILSRESKNRLDSVRTLGLDFGLLLKDPDKRAFGVSLLNLTRPDLSVTEYDIVGASRTLVNVGDRAPLTLKFGYREEIQNFTFLADFTRREASGLRPATFGLAGGIERWWYRSAARRLRVEDAPPALCASGCVARVGVNVGDEVRTLNLGFGLRFYGAQIDYAAVLGLSGGRRVGHVIQLAYRFGENDPRVEFEKVLGEEMRFREQLSAALQEAGRREGELTQEIFQLQKEVGSLKADLAAKQKEVGSKDEALGKSAERINRVERRLKNASRELDLLQRGRIKLETGEASLRYKNDLASYRRLAAGGAPESVRRATLEKILREYQGTGVDLSQANAELRKLLR